METAKTEKFRWGEVSDLNSGHTSNEWGIAKKPKSRENVIIAYDVVWNT